ncbi:MAG: T9SS type A sorting domain-containing protein [Bacteroidetes bacterium]|nr:T9SS type A sorting domain-containing protein [Bacteroidota bacterium]
MKLFIFCILISSFTFAQWQKVDLDVGTSNSMIKYNNNLFVGGKYKGFYISKDNGISWELSNSGINSNSFEAYSFLVQESLYACTNSGIYLFEVEKENWKQLNEFSSDALYINGDNIILGLNPSGLIYSVDNGISWHYDNENLFLDSKSIIRYKDYILAGSTSGLYKSLDSGKTWENVNSGSFLKLYNYEGKLYSSQHQNLFQSFDDGVTWESLFLSYYFSNDFVIYDDVFLASNYKKGILCKREIMPRWREANWGLDINSSRFLFIDETLIYTSNDNGLWQRPLNDFQLPELEIKDNYNFEAIAGEHFSSALYLGNHGYDTAFVSNIVSSNDLIKIKYESLIIPPDWSKYTSIDFFAEDIGETKTTITINTNTKKRVYKIDVVISVIPAEFYLKQNYPNPFNPFTIIEYSIPKSDHVRLLVYNSAGQVIKTLVDKKQIGGKHQVSFSSDGIASGVYYYQLLVNNIKETKKMVLIK